MPDIGRKMYYICNFKKVLKLCFTRALKLTLHLKCAENTWSRRNHLKHGIATVVAVFPNARVGVCMCPSADTQELRMIWVVY